MIDIPDFVYPKDPQGNALCPRCHKPIKECVCPELKLKPSKSLKITPKISLDKSGRKGKIVTVVAGLPPQEAYLKEKAKFLKGKTGSGGTHYIQDNEGVIEIQGDHRDVVSQLLI